MGENGQGPQGSKSQLLGHQIAMWLSSGPREGARLGTSLGTLSAAWRAQWGTPPTRCPAPVGTSGGSRPLPSATSSKLPDSSIELECEESLSFDLSQGEAAGFKCLNGRRVEGKAEVLPGGAGALGAPEGKIRSGGLKL